MKIKTQNELKIETDVNKIAKKINNDKLFSKMYYIFALLYLIVVVVSMYSGILIMAGIGFMLSSVFFILGLNFETHQKLDENRILILQKKWN